MQIKVQSGDIAAVAADAIVVNLFEGVTAPGGGTGAVDEALGGAISQLIAAGDIRGKLGEFTLVHTLGKTAVAARRRRGPRQAGRLQRRQGARPLGRPRALPATPAPEERRR